MRRYEPTPSPEREQAEAGKALSRDMVRNRKITDLRSLLRILEQLIERISSRKADDVD